jgi:hypothetical protein
MLFEMKDRHLATVLGSGSSQTLQGLIGQARITQEFPARAFDD